MLFKLLSKLPLGVLYLLADVLYFTIYYVVPYRKAVVYRNLHRSFPEKTDAEIRRLAKRFYKNASDVTIEVIKAISITREELTRRVTITNPEILDELTERHQSFILMAAHQCNWEWLLLATSAMLPVPTDAIYKPLHVKHIDKLMFDTRSRFGGNPIPLKHSIVEIMKRKDIPKAFAIVADQTPSKGEEKYWATFLNQDTPFAVGAEKIAKITKYPVFFVAMRRTARGRYDVSLIPLATPPYGKDRYPIIERYVHEAEKQILAHPEDWLWTYRKWKYKKPLYG